MSAPSGLALVAAAPLVEDGVELRFALRPGDRAFVVPGEPVAAGAPIAGRLRDPRTEVLPARASVPDTARPGDRWTAGPGRGADPDAPEGELLFASGRRWRVAGGEHVETLEAPVAGVVTAVVAGSEIRIATGARAIRGRELIGGTTTGRLEVISPRDGEVRATDLDVDLAGAIVVVGARIDAEAITRARAVGIRGIVVATLGTRERRDALATDERGRAAVHGLPPFAILVLEGAVRLPIGASTMAVLDALEGRTVALVPEPAALVVDAPSLALPAPDPTVVRIRSGPWAGLEGAFAGLAGPRRVDRGVIVETAWVRIGDRPPVAVALGDLDRRIAR